MQIASRRWLARPRNLSDAGIHSDAAAQRLGFAGGFVPGVALYEHIVADLLRQGLPWLHQGSVELHFRRPVYDGEEVAFAIDAAEPGFTITAPDGGDPRAAGRLMLDVPPPDVTTEPAVTPERAPLGAPDQIGIPLRIEQRPDAELAAIAAASSGFPQDEGGRMLVPAGLWLNPINLLRAYFDAPVTIHYAGRVWHHSPVYDGETVVKRGAITGFEERKGNRIVAFTVAVTTADGRPVVTIEHQSVFELARAREVSR